MQDMQIRMHRTNKVQQQTGHTAAPGLGLHRSKEQGVVAGVGPCPAPMFVQEAAAAALLISSSRDSSS
jgi:hypothetical protein